MIHIVLFQPEIPQNTGNVGRMCALTRSRLHLIHPLGFKITDRNLRRAGMDYWFSLDVHEHADWERVPLQPLGPGAAVAVFDTGRARLSGTPDSRMATGLSSETREAGLRIGSTSELARPAGDDTARESRLEVA